MHWLTRHLKRLTPRQKAIGILALVVIVLAAVWSVPGQAANPPAPSQTSAGNSVQQIVFSDILSPIVNALIRMFSFLTAYIVGLLVLVAQQNNFINSAPVVTGYPIVRDLSNMVFIVALLIIAAGTILRLENYRYNRLLGRLIIMAFLVNLARFITGFFIQTSQVFMLTFVNAFKDIALGNFAYMFGLDAVLTFSQNHTTGTDAALFITLVAGLAMMIIAFSVTLALTVILIVRIIALWILTILSPLAYALRIIPNTERYASRWWSEFGKYTVTGPVLAFFLWLALALTAASSCTGATCTSQNNILFSQKNGTSQDASLQKITSDTESQIGTLRQEFVTEIFDPNRLLTFIVAIIFLIMGMQYAAKSGTFGANFAKSVYERGLGAGATLTGLNAIRDRTVAPIQGYLAQRRSRRDAGIKERTETLGTAVDRTLSATVGQVGRGRAAVTGAAGAALRGTGQVITGKKTVQEALGGVAESAQRGLDFGTRARRQARQRIAEQRARTASADATEFDMAGLSKNQLVSFVNSANVGQVRAAGMAMAKRNMFTSSPQDRALAQKTYSQIQSMDKQREEFENNIIKNNPDVATEVVFKNWSTGTAAVDKLITRAIEGDIDLSKFLKESDMAAMTAAIMKQNPGMSQDDAANYFGQSVLKQANTEDKFQKLVGTLSPYMKKAGFNNIKLDDTYHLGQREMLANIGNITEAFNMFNQATGAWTEDITQATAYMKENEQKVADNLKNSNISDTTLKSQKMLEEVHNLDKVDDDVVLAGTKNAAFREKYTATMSKIIERINPTDTFNPADPTFRKFSKLRTSQALAARGGKVKNGAGVDVNVLDQITSGITAAHATDGDQAVARIVRTEGKNLSRFNHADATAHTQELFNRNITVGSLANIFEKNPQTAVEAIRYIRSQAPTDPDFDKKAKAIDRNDILTGL